MARIKRGAEALPMVRIAASMDPIRDALTGTDGGDDSDFRNVPASDRGNAGYTDRGKLGEFAPSNRAAYRNPEGLRVFAGYGADDSDLERGWCEPDIREPAAYDLTNYKLRGTLPRSADDDMSQTMASDEDLEFRNRNRRSRGFLTRPHVPTERG